MAAGLLRLAPVWLQWVNDNEGVRSGLYGTPLRFQNGRAIRFKFRFNF